MTVTDLDPQQAALLFEHLPCWVAVIDERHRLSCLNPAFVEAFGARAGEPCYAVMKNRGAACEDCVALQALAARDPRAAEEEGRGTGGDELRYQVRAVPLARGEGEPGQVLLIAVDQTRQSELASELAQAERLASVGLTTAGLAHSIKNILAGLEGGMYLMTSGIEREDEKRIAGAWEMVNKYIEQVSSLVKNLLRYAKADQPIVELVDPAKLVRETAELYESKAAMSDIRIDVDLEADLPSITVDKEGMRACLANLASNALDACAWDPTASDEDADHVIRLVARSGADESLIFQVSDNGMGISEENMAKVLRSSFTTKGMRGTGLGLLLTQKVVKEHGGTIQCRSEVGKGTSFTIELPRTAPSQTAEEATDGAERATEADR